MRIVEAISDTNIGGAGILLWLRLKHRDPRFSYHVIIPRGSALKARFLRIGVSVWEVDVSGDRSFSLSAIPKYLSLLRKIRPDLINCHGALSCRIAALLCGVPCRIYTRHCVYPLPRWQKNAVGSCLVGLCQTLLSHRMIAVAEAAKENLVGMGVPSHRVTVIINGVEQLPALSLAERKRLRADLGIPSDVTVVGICARLEPCKGHRFFLEAARLLLTHSTKYRFLVIGDGSLGEELRTWCHAQGIASYVIFTGFVEDVSPYFNLMDVNVNCSVGTETSSLALSEGMSLGIPAIVSDYGGNPYMVRHGINGLVCPQGDSLALAEAIERLSREKTLYTRLSRQARLRFAEELNAEAMTKKTEKLYAELFRSTQN